MTFDLIQDCSDTESTWTADDPSVMSLGDLMTSYDCPDHPVTQPKPIESQQKVRLLKVDLIKMSKYSVTPD